MKKKVVVVGAGIVGLACASQLQIAGCDVTVVDPQGPGEGCSSGNAGCLSRGSCVPLGLPGIWKQVPGWLMNRNGPLSLKLRHLPSTAPWLWKLYRSTSMARVTEISDALFPLVDPCIELWRSLSRWAGVSDLIRQNGYAFAYESEASFRSDSLGRQLRVDRGIRIEVLQGAEVRQFDPALSPGITQLVLMPEQGNVANPLRLSRALAKTLLDGGARFINQSVRDFGVRDGKADSVILESGEVGAEAVVLAAGARSAALAKKLGSVVPLEAERGYHAMLADPSVIPRVPVCSGKGKFFVSPMEEGLRLAGTVELSSVDALPDFNRVKPLIDGAKRILPELTFSDSKLWMGCRPSMPDSLPVLGRAPAASNAFFAFGHGHIGLTAAPKTGQIIASLVLGERLSLDISPYRANRF